MKALESPTKWFIVRPLVMNTGLKTLQSKLTTIQTDLSKTSYFLSIRLMSLCWSIWLLNSSMCLPTSLHLGSKSNNTITMKVARQSQSRSFKTKAHNRNKGQCIVLQSKSKSNIYQMRRSRFCWRTLKISMSFQQWLHLIRLICPSSSNGFAKEDSKWLNKHVKMLSYWGLTFSILS